MSRIRGFFSSFVNPSPSDNQPRLATATTPDKIIVAAVIQSFAKEFESWTKPYGGYATSDGLTLPDLKGRGLRDHKDTDTSRFHLKKAGSKPLEVKGEYSRKRWRDGSYDYHVFAIEWRELKVNGINLDPKHIPEILRAYSLVADTKRAAEETARKAKQDMERNEQKWDLVENLVGMVRDANGRVVFKQYEENKKEETDEEQEQPWSSEADVAGDTVVANDESPLLRPLAGNRRGKPARSKASIR